MTFKIMTFGWVNYRADINDCYLLKNHINL